LGSCVSGTEGDNQRFLDGVNEHYDDLEQPD
jgi:hypothetical protein